jgi:lambda repressor-like predicted transcriptional regulator
MAFWFRSPQDFADEVLTALKEDGRSREWLSRMTGISSSTLHSQLVVDPSRMTVVNALRISQHVPVGERAA